MHFFIYHIYCDFTEQMSRRTCQLLPTTSSRHFVLLCLASSYISYLCHRDIYYRIDVTFYDKMVPGDQGIIITLNQKMTYKQVCASQPHPF